MSSMIVNFSLNFPYFFCLFLKLFLYYISFPPSSSFINFSSLLCPLLHPPLIFEPLIYLKIIFYENIFNCFSRLGCRCQLSCVFAAFSSTLLSWNQRIHTTTSKIQGFFFHHHRRSHPLNTKRPRPNILLGKLHHLNPKLCEALVLLLSNIEGTTSERVEPLNVFNDTKPSSKN